VTITSGSNNDRFTLPLRLVPGAGSDGIELGTSDAELSFGSLSYSLSICQGSTRSLAQQMLINLVGPGKRRR